MAFLNVLCYADWWWMLPLQFLLLPFITEWDKHREQYLKRQYALGFQTVLQSIMTSIQAGYTLENACRAALPELTQHCEKKDPTILQLKKIVYGMDLGIPVEQLFLNYARETKNEDIRQFAAVMEIVKGTGGNMVLILKKTMENFQKKIDTEEEIRVVLSGVVYEKNIMLFMPLLILGYMRLTNRAYMACLYDSLAGHILVSVVLAGIVACYYWTESMISMRI